MYVWQQEVVPWAPGIVSLIFLPYHYKVSPYIGIHPIPIHRYTCAYDHGANVMAFIQKIFSAKDSAKIGVFLLYFDQKIGQ
jgi:hypothetical protein